MKDLKLHDLSARVVAWHNRHPLARRITAADVHSVGYVVLPYLDADGAATNAVADAVADGVADAPTGAVSAASHGGATLRERAMARAQETAKETADAPDTAAALSAASAASRAPSPTPSSSRLTPDFTEDFIAPLTPATVGRWAAEHGIALASARVDAPVRHVARSGPSGITSHPLLWLLTAQLEVGRARTRVLVGAADDGQPAAVLGRRLWSPARIGVWVALPLLLLLLGFLMFGLRHGAPVPAEAISPLAAADLAASVPAVAASTAASTAAGTTAEGAEPARPVDVEATLGRVALPPIGPRADERRRAAERAVEQALPGSASAPTPTPTPAPTPATAARTAPPPASTGPAFAVSTRVLRTRTEGEQVAAAMRALLVKPATPGTPPMQVEVMPVGEDWRVVGWPYADRALAEKARALLAARGMKVQVIDF